MENLTFPFVSVSCIQYVSHILNLWLIASIRRLSSFSKTMSNLSWRNLDRSWKLTMSKINFFTNITNPGRITVRVLVTSTLFISKSTLIRFCSKYGHSTQFSARSYVLFCTSIFRYLNQQHIRKHKVSDAEILYGNGNNLSIAQEQMEIGELGLDIWRIFMIQNLGDTLVKQILQGIEKDRIDGNLNARDIETINGTINSFVMVQDYKKKGNLKLYETIFEQKMLEASGEYFRGLASKLLQTCSVSDYMVEMIRILEDENIRAHKFFNMSSIPKLKRECEDRMITDHKTFLYSECKDMVSNDKRDDLRNLYILLKPINEGLKELIQFLLDQIKNEGTESVVNLKGENVILRMSSSTAKQFLKYKIFDFSGSYTICGKYAPSTQQVRESYQ